MRKYLRKPTTRWALIGFYGRIVKILPSGTDRNKARKICAKYKGVKLVAYYG